MLMPHPKRTVWGSRSSWSRSPPMRRTPPRLAAAGATGAWVGAGAAGFSAAAGEPAGAGAGGLAAGASVGAGAAGLVVGGGGAQAARSITPAPLTVVHKNPRRVILRL